VHTLFERIGGRENQSALMQPFVHTLFERIGGRESQRRLMLSAVISILEDQSTSQQMINLWQSIMTGVERGSCEQKVDKHK